MAGTLLIISDKEGIEAIEREEQKQRQKDAGIMLGLIFLAALLSK